MTTDWLILARATHFGACLLLFGIFAFDRGVASAALARGSADVAGYWCSRMRWLSAAALVVAGLSGAAWFYLVAATMSGQTPTAAILQVVWDKTQFGIVWKLRLVVWLLAAAALAGSWFWQTRSTRRKKMIWIELALSGGLLGSLAWAGHGQVGQPSGAHLAADVLHLLVAGVWPAGLVPFALVWRKLRRVEEPARKVAMATLVNRFSAISLAAVATLTATGLVNAWFLVGTWANLFTQPYGWWLLAKIALFIGAVAIGAVNLLQLSPKLRAENEPEAGRVKAAARLQVNVGIEVGLAVVIVVVVAVLGLLPPALG